MRLKRHPCNQVKVRNSVNVMDLRSCLTDRMSWVYIHAVYRQYRAMVYNIVLRVSRMTVWKDVRVLLNRYDEGRD